MVSEVSATLVSALLRSHLLVHHYQRQRHHPEPTIASLARMDTTMAAILAPVTAMAFPAGAPKSRAPSTAAPHAAIDDRILRQTSTAEPAQADIMMVAIPVPVDQMVPRVSVRSDIVTDQARHAAAERPFEILPSSLHLPPSIVKLVPTGTLTDAIVVDVGPIVSLVLVPAGRAQEGTFGHPHATRRHGVPGPPIVDEATYR